MAANQENVEVVDPETGEVFPLNVGSLVSDIRNVFLTKRRAHTEGEVWSKLSEQDQKDEIIQFGELAKSVVFKVVEMVAEQDRVCATVAITKFAVDVDKGEITITSKGFANDQALHDLNHSKGKVAMLTVVDTAQFNQRGDDPQPDPDEPEMFPDHDGASPTNAELASAALKEMPAEEPETEGEIDMDDLYKSAKTVVLRDNKASISHIQRSLSIGYNRAASPAEQLEHNGIISEPSETGRRTVLNQDAATLPDDGDDLHVEPESGDQSPPEEKSQEQDPVEVPEEREIPKTGKETFPADEPADLPDDPAGDGQAARVEGKGPDENPYDGGTDEHAAWVAAYNTANDEITEMVDEGYKAASDGKPVSSNPWKDGSMPSGFWLEGFERAHRDLGATKGSNDSTADGRRAAERGEPFDANPFPEGDPKHRFWSDGWNSFEQPAD